MPPSWPRPNAGSPPARGGGAVQLGLFADTGQGAFHTLAEARAMVDEEFRRRRDALATGYGVADVAEPEPVGCLLCVEAGSC